MSQHHIGMTIHQLHQAGEVVRIRYVVVLADRHVWGSAESETGIQVGM